ncbi:hypothetical protein ACFYR1_52985 [Streptomyces canus]|uniref:hypothetical protein n=1 Tax=Streptomyces canus TaxID=58343 RepID=UPI00367D3EC6
MEDIPQNSHAAKPIAMVHGVVRNLLNKQGIPYALVVAASLKYYATGKGSGDKVPMALAAYKRAGLEFEDDNQCDAAWLRWAGLDWLGCPEFSLPAVQRAALKKAQWQNPLQPQYDTPETLRSFLKLCLDPGHGIKRTPEKLAEVLPEPLVRKAVEFAPYLGTLRHAAQALDGEARKAQQVYADALAGWIHGEEPEPVRSMPLLQAVAVAYDAAVSHAVGCGTCWPGMRLAEMCPDGQRAAIASLDTVPRRRPSARTTRTTGFARCPAKSSCVAAVSAWRPFLNLMA